MSPEERDLLTGLFDRIRGAANAPREPEAEALIQDAVRAQPYAPYYLAQTVLVQDQALQAADKRIQDLEARVKDLESSAASQQRPKFLTGLGSLFGRSSGYAPSPPPPSSGRWNQAPPQGAYPPSPPPAGGYGPAPGPWGGQQAPSPGGGFLTGALGTAAGVAGGVLLADSIRSLFAGHNNTLGIGTGFGGGTPAGLGGETVINNYFDSGDSLAAQDAAQDAQQDAFDDFQYAQDYPQDAGPDQGGIQDASDYGPDDYDSGDDSYDA